MATVSGSLLVEFANPTMIITRPRYRKWPVRPPKANHTAQTHTRATKRKEKEIQDTDTMRVNLMTACVQRLLVEADTRSPPEKRFQREEPVFCIYIASARISHILYMRLMVDWLYGGVNTWYREEVDTR